MSYRAGPLDPMGGASWSYDRRVACAPRSHQLAFCVGIIVAVLALLFRMTQLPPAGTAAGSQFGHALIFALLSGAVAFLITYVIAQAACNAHETMPDRFRRDLPFRDALRPSYAAPARNDAVAAARARAATRAADLASSDAAASVAESRAATRAARAATVAATGSTLAGGSRWY